MKCVYLIIILLFPLITGAQIITTVPGTSSTLYDPAQLAFDKYGNLYCGEGLGNKVYKIDTAGIVTIFAGTGPAGYSGDSGLATLAKLNQPGAITTDTFGNVYIADGGNNRIRKVNIATGIITTIAGIGSPGFGGDHGPAISAILHCPSGLHFDKYGNLYVADFCNDRLRKIDTSGIIITIAGNGILGSTGDGGFATMAKCDPDYNMCTDAFGNLYFVDQANYSVRKIDTFGIISTIAGDTSGAYTYIGDGVPALGAPMSPGAVIFDENGLLLIADYFNNRVRRIDSSGIIHTIAGNGIGGSIGDGTLATAAEVNTPAGIAFDKCGNLYISQINEPRIRKVTYDTSTPPTVSIVPETSDTVCFGWPEKYIATVIGGGAIITYKWYVNGVLVSSTSGNVYLYNPSIGDSIYCVVHTGLPCSNNRVSNVIHIIVIPPPTIAITSTPTAAIGSIVTVNATIAGASSSYMIKWYNNSSLFNTTTIPIVTYTKMADIDHITATIISTLAGCNDTITSSIFTVTASTTEVNNVSIPQAYIYPNPAHTEITIFARDITNVTISNLLGQMLISKDCNTNQISINIESLPSGVYVVILTDIDGRKTIKKIIKQ